MKKLLLLLVISSSAFVSSGQAVYCNKVIGGYVADWEDASNVNYNQLTHAYFAFIGSDASGNLCTYEASGATVVTGPSFENSPQILAKFNSFLDACTAAKTKKIISLGGYGCDPFMNSMVSSGNLNKFVTNLMAFVDKYKLDGIDIDWEDIADATQGANYGQLCDALRTATTAKGKLLIATVVTGYRAPNFPHAKVAKCDFVQLMAYDQLATWSTSPAGNHSTIADANAGIAKWSGYGIPASKIVLGLPFYGYQQANSGGSKTKDWTYRAFVAAYPNAGDVDNFPVPGTSETIGLNGITTIKSKVDIGYNNLGVMVWEMTNDLPYTNPKSLHLAIAQEMKKLCPSGSGNPTGINEISNTVSSIYYNSQLNQINISITQQGKVKASMINLLGQELFSSNLGSVSAGDYNVGLGNVNLKSGVYIVSVTVNDETISSKIYVE